MSQRRVLLTTDVVGGVWDFCITLGTTLVSSFDAHVTLLALGEPSAAQRGAAASTGLELVSAPLKLEWMQDAHADVEATTALVGRVARQMRADVVHANQFAAACADVNVPIVLTLHSDVLSWRKWTLGDRCVPVPGEWRPYAELVRTAIAAADRVVAVSRFLATEVNELYGVQCDFDVIHNGWPAPRSARASEPRCGTLLAGRIWDAAKNIPLAAQGAHGLDTGPVRVAGEPSGPEGGRASLPPPLTGLGFLPRHDLDNELDRAAIYLSPARYDPFGLLPLQAALRGCALLLSDIPSYREVWADAALYFAPTDPAALRDQWRRLLVDLELRDTLHQRAARRAQTDYTVERMAHAYQALYTHSGEAVAA